MFNTYRIYPVSVDTKKNRNLNFAVYLLFLLKHDSASNDVTSESDSGA